MFTKKIKLDVLIKNHFKPISTDRLVLTERKFPDRVRSDLQKGLERFLADGVAIRGFLGILNVYGNTMGIDFAGLLVKSHREYHPSPPVYDEVDIGEDRPIRCLKNGLWLLEREGMKFAVLMERRFQFERPEGIKVQVAALDDEHGLDEAGKLFDLLEDAVKKSVSYRGKILSLENNDMYTGESTGIRVHRLPSIDRDRVILPSRTLELIERNILRFVDQRSRLAERGQASKKGLLFYGPPGTGKTHTIRYLAGALKEHTTLLIAAEQITLLSEYMTLARLLQPCLVVIEDVDLIAKDRREMSGPCEEALLNKLLNEMDGLNPDSRILFILTTNRPETLESALASRPGRVDQAIEFPLPDEPGRGRLVDLYSKGLSVSDDVKREIVVRTAGVSASFIKELMRRCAQFQLERSDDGAVEIDDFEFALDEMLFSGGSLNRKLLGASIEGDHSCR